MEETRIRLDYAQLPPWHRRRVFRRLLLGAILLLVVLIFLRWGAEPLANRIRLLHWQRQAMAVVYPATQVAWEEDPAEIQKLAGSAKYGPGWATFSSGATTKAYYLAPAPTRNLFMIPGTPGASISPVFAHGRNAGRGRRLVYVSIEGRPYAFMQSSSKEPSGFPLFTVITMKPAGITSPVFSRTGWSSPKLESIPAGQLRFYWGQPDAQDAAHFTIIYETASGRGTIDGWLQADDTVKLTVRDGPAADK